MSRNLLVFFSQMIQETSLHQKGKILNYMAQWIGDSLQTFYIQGPAPGCITLSQRETTSCQTLPLPHRCSETSSPALHLSHSWSEIIVKIKTFLEAQKRCVPKMLKYKTTSTDTLKANTTPHVMFTPNITRTSHINTQNSLSLLPFKRGCAMKEVINLWIPVIYNNFLTNSSK